MSQWYRRYVGTSTDHKFMGVARRAKTTLPNVHFVWELILESCSERDCSAYLFDADACDTLMAVDDGVSAAIEAELERAGMLDDKVVVSWERRQWISDTSTPRVQKHRASRRGGADETAMKRYETAPESESESESESNHDDSALRAGSNVRLPAIFELKNVDTLMELVREAAGDRWGDEALCPALRDPTPLVGLLTGAFGPPCDVELDLLACIRARAPGMNKGGIRSTRYLVQMVIEWRDRRLERLKPMPVKTQELPLEHPRDPRRPPVRAHAAIADGDAGSRLLAQRRAQRSG